MKPRRFFYRCAFIAQILIISSAYSQISIVSSDYQNQLNKQIKHTNYYSDDTSGLKSIINAAGANKNWDLTGRTYYEGETTTSTLLDKSTSNAPQQTNSAFTAANLVVKRQSSHEPWSTNWTYELLTESGLSYYGYVEDSLGTVLSNQTNSPSWKSRTFPTTYQSSWSWSSSVTSRTYNASGGSVGSAITMKGSDVIDGYGTVKTPEGSFTCLRLKSKTEMLFGFFTLTSYSYEFLDQNRTYAEISADETGGIPESVTYYRPGTITGIYNEPTLVPENIQLLQNFPNPFSHSTLIEFYLPKEEFVTLVVYDRLGNEVSLLVHQTKSAGNHTVSFSAQNQANGVYFYCLQAGQFSQTRKLVLLK